MGTMVYSLLWVILGSAGFVSSTVGTTPHTPDPGAIWSKKLPLVGEPEEASQNISIQALRREHGHTSRNLQPVGIPTEQSLIQGLAAPCSSKGSTPVWGDFPGRKLLQVQISQSLDAKTCRSV